MVFRKNGGVQEELGCSGRMGGVQEEWGGGVQEEWGCSGRMGGVQEEWGGVNKVLLYKDHS